ncbi:MAG: Co2+/Mg2+ efflux protein ApaG [Ginsengibacter sp.]
MVSKISEGVRVSVETFYQQEHSSPLNGDFMFTYRITLENNNPFPVQLLRRHWYIFDSLTANSEVEGEGVVGVQPIIYPLEKYQYMSGCNLRSEIGRMHGLYFMENCHNKRTFLINVPAFEMIAPFKLN